jgi:hypothetical protein
MLPFAGLFVAQAEPAGITIFEVRNTTELQLTQSWPEESDFSRSLNSADFLSDSILINPFTGTEGLLAEATAGAFSVRAFTPSATAAGAWNTSSRALASCEVWFSPIMSGTTGFQLEFSADGHWWDASRGVLSLVNTTTGTEVWNYEWAFRSGTVGGISVFDLMQNDVSADMVLGGELLESDIYKLTMLTETFAGDSPRSPQVTLQISGLNPISAVPEPTALSLVAIGALLHLSRRRS